MSNVIIKSQNRHASGAHYTNLKNKQSLFMYVLWFVNDINLLVNNFALDNMSNEKVLHKFENDTVLFRDLLNLSSRKLE